MHTKTVTLISMLMMAHATVLGSPSKFIKDTWNSTKKTVSNIFEPSESAVFTREIDAAPNSRLIIKNQTGGIAITRAKDPKIFIEAEKRGKKSQLQNTNIQISAKDVVINVETKADNPENTLPVHYTITVPDSVTVIAEQQSGDITIKDVGCPLSLQIQETGSMKIENVSGSVTARALKGSITLSHKKLTEDTSIFLEAHQTIIVSLPKNSNASLQAKTIDGLITTKMPVTLDPVTTLINREAWRHLRRNITGTIGRGGSSVILDATTGNIVIKPLENT